LQKATACAAGDRDKRSSELHQNQLQNDGGMAYIILISAEFPLGRGNVE
jgi:hypothetical protein